MQYKDRECVWDSGQQTSDITYTGEHTWEAIRQAGGGQLKFRRGPVIATLAVLALGVGVWFWI